MHRVRLGVAVLLVICGAGCGENAVSPETQPGKAVATDQISLVQDCEQAVNESSPADFGNPLPGLPAALLARFDTGKDEFEDIETSDEGLGPVFNDVSCTACHSQGGTGGAGTGVETRFGKRNADGSFDPLTQFGG